jgi:DNA polymerase I-like protein with 3'-5' exonuclease and polymerase domains
MKGRLKEYWNKLPEFLQNPDPNIYRSNNYVYADFETTNLDKGSPRNPANSIVCAVWITGKDHPSNNTGSPVLKIKWGSEYELGELVRDIEQSDWFAAHNSKFEFGWLKRCGLDIDRTLSYCSQVGEYVLAGNRQFGQMASLDKCLARRGIPTKDSLVSRLMKSGVCPSEMPRSWLEKYGKRDVLSGHKLMLKQRREIFQEGLQKSFFTHMIFTPVLGEIEGRGMCLDEDRVRTVHSTFQAELREYDRELDEITGGINTGSTKQMAEFLYNVMKFPIPKDHRGKELRNKPTEDWPDGIPHTNQDAIAKLKGKNKEQKRFLEIVAKRNKLKQSMSKSLDKFLECVENEEDNILYANLNQTRTLTHRLSSTGTKYKAQFQNFDRRFKPLFKARNPGWLVAEADEGQLEYRVAVYLGQDEAGLYDITHGVDAHGFTASIIFKEKWEACGGDRNTPQGKKIRTASKADTFKPLMLAA